LPLGAILAGAEGIPATLAAVTGAFPELPTEAASLVAEDTEEAAILVAGGTEAGGTVRKLVPALPLSEPKTSSA
jgi:hypothetical protein